MLLLVFIAVGVGLLGGAALEVYDAVRVTRLADAVHTTGTITGSYSEVTKVRQRYGSGYDERSWFPQPVVTVVAADGERLEATDPNSVPYMLYKAGDRVPVVILATPGMRESGVAPQVYIDDLYTRYAFPAIVMLIGVLCVALPLVVWPAARMPEAATPRLPVKAKVFVYAIIALTGFAAIMAGRDPLYGLLPDGFAWQPKNRDLIEAVYKSDIAAARRLLDGGADPGAMAVEANQVTALMLALSMRQDALVAQMLKHDFDAGATDVTGKTLLYYAVRYENPTAVAVLIARKAGFNCRFENLLFTALSVGNIEIAGLLIEAGHPYAKKHPESRIYPLDMAIDAGLPAVVKMLVARQAPFTAPQPFIDAVMQPEAERRSGNPGHLRFGKMALREWRKLVATQWPAPQPP
jgi:hypothetical protein